MTGNGKWTGEAGQGQGPRTGRQAGSRRGRERDAGAGVCVQIPHAEGDFYTSQHMSIKERSECTDV